MKIRQVGADFFHAERRTDRHVEANSRFSQFCERVQKWLSQSHHEPQSPSRAAYKHRNCPKIYGLDFIKPEKLLPCSQNLSWIFILILFSHQRPSLTRRFLSSCFLINFSHALFRYPHQRYKSPPLHGLNLHIIIFGFHVTFSTSSLTEQRSVVDLEPPCVKLPELERQGVSFPQTRTGYQID